MYNYLCRPLAGGEGIVTLGGTLSCCHAVCASAALVSAAKVMRCIQCSLFLFVFGFMLRNSRDWRIDHHTGSGAVERLSRTQRCWW